MIGGKSRRKCIHGLAGTPIYKTWHSMHARCNDPANKDYKNYGGRGIRICERWNSLENFCIDMGNPPTGMTLNRVNNDGNYEPSNCEWATRTEQQNNTRRNHIITYQGITLTMAQWAKRIGINYTTLRKRLRSGWVLKRALDAKDSE